ncbi:hypothetical protein CsSME_00003956 [Camellia sinensis var. sinensis]
MATLKPAKPYRRHPFNEFRARVCCNKMDDTKQVGKPPKFKGISHEVQEILEADLDDAQARRRAREAFKQVQLSIDHYLFKVFLLFSFWHCVLRKQKTCLFALNLIVFLSDYYYYYFSELLMVN